ncbi:MAG TPA: hypothetical protein VHG28_19985 [Longimicrobiaceae bacterium]|nr:hypothetical protein [Longimicrobiaceae bacterium]
MRNALLLAAALLLPECQDIPGPGACTLIGCESGLAVELVGAPAGPYRIEAYVREDGPRQVFDCPDPARCLGEAFFAGFTPEVVTIRVTTASGTVTRTFRPEYRKSRPNGPDCPPECVQARVRVETAGSPAPSPAAARGSP